MTTTGTQAHPDLLLTTSPFVKDRAHTAWIMWQVNLALAPVVGMAVWYYGLNALLILAASSLGAVVMERVGQKLSGPGGLPGGLHDGSALLTGLLLGLTLPPSIPLWMAFVGGVIAIGLGKVVFGGIGGNRFNPALVGRAFLQAAFPVALTTWPVFGDPDRFLSVSRSLLAPPFMIAQVDGLSQATPLASMSFEGTAPAWSDMALGSTTGSLGEAAGLVILLAGAYLAIRGVLNWRIPVAVLGGTALLATILNLVDPAVYAPASFHLFAGGLMLGAVFMATDPVSSPLTHRGCWLFGIGIGLMVVVIRQFGGLPEGVMYAILFMNALAPLIDRLTQPRTFGSDKRSPFTR